MKLSISNIAWQAEYDWEMYNFLSANKFDGLEIAPTRIFPDSPYDCISQAKDFKKMLKNDYGLSVSSVQSIWFGVVENIFGSETERQKLIDYTKKAIDFANALDCRNIVFGCPKNRAVPADMHPDIYLPLAYNFFNQIGDYAASNGTYISIEPNPPIYSTNFINTTAEAFDICKKLNNPGIKINIDMGTFIHNNESLTILWDNIDLINHVHISEPRLAPVEKRKLHVDLINELRNLNYANYLSIEMANPNDIDLVKKTVLYIYDNI